MIENKQLQVGLVGVGGMGTAHYHNYGALSDIQVVATVGASEQDKMTAQKWGLPIYESIHEMVTHHDLDIIDICTPTFTHYALAKESIAHGKHTIVEKPIALSLADAKTLFAVAKEAGVQLYVAQVLQFTPEVAVLRDIVKSERYGKPLDGMFQRLTEAPKWSQGSWLFDKEKSGLLPFDLHIHDLDVIVSIFGAPDTINYTSGGNADKSYLEHYRMQYGYDHGLHVCAEAGWLNASIPFMASWRVYFERGMLIANGETLIGYDSEGNSETFDITDPISIPTGINVPANGWFYRELGHFASCVRQNIPSPLVPEAQVLSVLSIVEKM